MNDLRPYVCTFLDCSQAGETYGSRSAFLYREQIFHESQELSRREFQRGLFETCTEFLFETCVFCEKVQYMADLKDRTEHVARHMEEIAFTVVTKPYEDWDFYSDASSVKYEDIHNPRNTTASYDAEGDEDTTYQTRRMQRVGCAMCTEEKTFSRPEALRRHMRIVHPILATRTKHSLAYEVVGHGPLEPYIIND